MKLFLILIGVGLVSMGCSPVEVAIPLAGADGWLQILADNEVRGVPLLAMNW
ncbi:hypothetical protein [Litoreibacter janthinus]|uniref:Uncharacterized protein n=1 Tax=Litoreibacter janthinus TaxID=670154 RepID=A0A1I6GM43_9RHOB|nr:hypothetical protein [Litoreibacter janthinus]SFR43283.1 hypothetical protein SAMN04488002_1700 [Litoreibacter janthinus]